MAVLIGTAGLPAYSQTAAQVGVRFDLAPLRGGSAIVSETFGYGFVYDNVYMHQVFTDPTWSKTYTQFQKLLPSTGGSKRGVIRFPNGDASQVYYWNDPSASWNAHGIPHATWVTPSHVMQYFASGNPGYTHRTPLTSDVIFQINTFSAAGYDPTCYLVYTAKTVLQPNGCPTGQATRDINGYAEFQDVNLTNLKSVADSAAKWYRKAVGTTSSGPGSYPLVPYAQQPDYWEIGNEDWIYWSPQQYAVIVKEVADKLIAANSAGDINPSRKPLRLLIQSNTKNISVGGVSIPNNGNWAWDVAVALNNLGFSLANIHGVSDHRYLTGNVADTIGTRTADVFSMIDGQEVTEINSLQTQLQNIKSTYALANKWQLWVTEYNLYEHQNPKPPGYQSMQQTQAHALMLADWTGRMMNLGVDRLLPHSADHHPSFALVGYNNNFNTTGVNPVMMPGGTVISKIAELFKGTVYQTLVKNNPQLKAYAAFHAPTNQLTLMLVNRDPVNATVVDLFSVSKDFAPSHLVSRSGTMQVLRSNPLTTSNMPPFSSPYTTDNPPVDWLTSTGLTFYRKTDGAFVPGQASYYLATAPLNPTPVTVTVPASSVGFFRMVMQ